MKKRMHLKRRRKKKLFLIPFILIILLILLVIKFIDIKPLIINYSEMEANKLATLVINTAIKMENIEKKRRIIWN